MAQKVKERRRYHGWIFAEEKEGMKDFFSIQHKDQVLAKGYGELGASRAVEFFEVEKGLGRVQLEPTPLGLRVFTVEEEEDGTNDNHSK